MKIQTRNSILLIAAFCAVTAFAQQPPSDLDKAPRPAEQSATRDRKTKEQKPASVGKVISDEDRKSLRREDQSEEEAAVLPYINNFFTTTRLGPEDVITVCFCRTQERREEATPSIGLRYARSFYSRQRLAPNRDDHATNGVVIPRCVAK